MASIISLRSRPALSFSFNDYAHAPCAYSSSANCCCCCCANSMYRVPISSGYCYNLYGLRQSSLIQWSPCRKLISGGLNSFYSARLPACDVDFSSYCDEVLRFRQMRVGGKKGGLRKCLVFEERYDIGDEDGDDEAEILLSLLTEDVSEVCLPATKKTRRLLRKPVVEETGGNGEVSKKCGSKKKRVDLGVLESENRYGHGSVVSSGQKDNWRRAEVIRREEEKEALLRQENRKARLREESGDALLINRTTREEENVGLLRKMSENEMDERKSSVRVREENRKVTSRSEEDVLRREENKQKLRKDGSSCSSYYSLSSTGDYESDNDIELREERYMGESLINHTRKSKNNAVVNQEARRKEEHQHEGYKEDHGVILEKKSTLNEYMGGSSVVESDFRKKSEKKLSDVSVQEMELREETSQKQSKHSMGRESNYKKSSDYQVSYDDRQEKSTARTKLEEERKQQHSQTSNEVIRQTGTRMKHRRFTGMQESHSDDVINTYGSQKTYGGKDEMTAKVESQETIEESQKAVGHSTREDEYRRTSVQLANISEGQDIDIRKTSTYQQRIETSVSDQDYSTSIHGSINAAKHKQYNQVSELVELRGTSQQLTKKEGKSILKKGSDKHLKQENVHLGYGSTSESRIIKRDDYSKRDNELGKVSPMQTGDSGKFDVEGQGRNKPNSAIQVGIQINLESGASAQKSNVGIATNEGSDGSLQVVSTSLNEQNQVISPELHSEIYGEGSSSGTHEHPSKFVYPEGRTIESAAQLEKSSTHYVGEFINQVREEISSSEIQKEKRAKFVHEEHYQHNLDQYNSGDSNSKKERETASDTKGPSDEIWKVAEPPAGESSKKEEQDDAIKAGKGHEKRTGRSLWNVISDIVLLRWSPHSESHGSGRKTGGRSSPNQSTSGETWFSGHEAVENEEVTQEKEQKSITLGLSDSNRGEKSHSQIEEGSSSSTFDGDIKRVGINIPSSSDALELQPISSSVHSGVISERIPTAETESTPLPAFRLQRSPAVHGVSEAEEAKSSSSDMKEKLNTVLTMTTESVIEERELRHNKFQRQDQVIKDRFDEWEDAYRLEAEQRKNDEKFMWEALLEAQNAADNWEVPVGAVLVHNGKIIARGFNRVEELRDSTAHAEMICIREASNILRSWRLSETTLYVTLEPCPMCAGAILQARVHTVVWGAPNKLLGADGSWIRLFPDGDRGNGLELSDKPPAPVHPFHPKIIIRRGVLASECADAMQQFFKLRRKKDKESDSSSAPPTGSRVSHRPFKLLAKMHDAFSLMFCL